MTWHQIVLPIIAFALERAASPSAAERNLVPSLEHSFDVCTDRPAEPEWMQNIPLRQAYQRVLVQNIYRTQNLERIVEIGSCTCEIRFPPWDEAETTFHEHHANDERWEMLRSSDAYNRRANLVRLDAKAICEAAGNW